MEKCINITEETKNRYKVRLSEVNKLLLDINWVTQKSDFDMFIKLAIELREKIREIEIELLIDRIRKKIFDGGQISVGDLMDIESLGWYVPKYVWSIVIEREG